MTQETALTILKTGANVFLTGEPGAGKTYVINQYIAWAEAAGLNVAVTASTGIAATHIGGMTIHSWSGVGIKDSLSPYDLENITTKEKNVKRMKTAQVLVIDEISMLDGKVLDMVDKVLRVIRQKNEAFGGAIAHRETSILIWYTFLLSARDRFTAHYMSDSPDWACQ